MGEKAQQLRKVGTGLGLIYYGLCLIVLAAIIAGVGGGMAATQMGNNPQIRVAQPFNKNNPFAGMDPANQKQAFEALAQAGRPVVTVLVVASILALIGNLLDLIGRLMCLAVPSDCRARQFSTYPSL